MEKSETTSQTWLFNRIRYRGVRFHRPRSMKRQKWIPILDITMKRVTCYWFYQRPMMVLRGKPHNNKCHLPSDTSRPEFCFLASHWPPDPGGGFILVELSRDWIASGWVNFGDKAHKHPHNRQTWLLRRVGRIRECLLVSPTSRVFTTDAFTSETFVLLALGLTLSFCCEFVAGSVLQLSVI